jgi:GNAT superfamily N-acetyltransferase
MVEIDIGPARPEDAPAIADLVAQLGYPVRMERVTAYLREVRDSPRHEVLVARRPEGEVLGLLTLFCRPALRLDGWIATVEELVVRQGFRERGVGSRLVQFLKGLAAERGWARVEVAVARRREAHRREFFFTRGFVAAESVMFRWAPLEGRHPTLPRLEPGAAGRARELV